MILLLVDLLLVVFVLWFGWGLFWVLWFVCLGVILTLFALVVCCLGLMVLRCFVDDCGLCIVVVCGLFCIFA